MPTPTVIKQYNYSDAINRRYWDQKYWFDNFQVNPISAKVGGGAATGTAGDLNVLYTAFGQYEYNIIGTQTTLAPVIDAFGLNLTMTGTAGQGIELSMGQTALSPMAFTINEDAAFFFQVDVKVQDVSGSNPLIIGFRKVQAFNATLSNYTDFVSIGIVGTAGHIQLQTQLNTGGVTTTDTTQIAVDGAVMQLKIKISSTGVVTYEYNYAEPTVVAAFTFDANDIVIPFLRFTEAADVTTEAAINYLECGFQS